LVLDGRDADSEELRIREKHFAGSTNTPSFCERVRNYMKRKGLSFGGIQKMAKECGNSTKERR
jgi:hypothetical protein